MAELATVARPYAEALFRVASLGDLSAWSGLVSEMAQVAAHPEIRSVADNPKVSHQQMRELFMSALKSPVGPEAKNFIGMLTDNGRLTLLPEIAAQFHALKNAGEGAADAEIISAFEMSDAQVKELAAVLERKFGRKLRPHVAVDPSLIGGVRVVVGDEVLDTSVRAKLQQMQVALAA
jgi:F-type H+-transporting ATPase subunit delta